MGGFLELVQLCSRRCGTEKRLVWVFYSYLFLTLVFYNKVAFKVFKRENFSGTATFDTFEKEASMMSSISQFVQSFIRSLLSDLFLIRLALF